MSLPIEQLLPDLLRALDAHNTLVLQAPPGAGKTTRVAPALLKAAWRGDRRIVMLEPRRLAARLAARYMAAEMGEKPGRTVGYRTRMDSRVSAQTRIEVVTEGVLTRLLQDDPGLEGYAAVIFDEYHERSLQADLGLALARESQQALRPDLRLLIMSATLDGGALGQALGGVPVVVSEGRSWPVEVTYSPPPRQRSWLEHTAATVLRALAETPGSVLVFVPGVGEIRRLASVLEDRLDRSVVLAPLYGDLPPDRQEAAVAPAPDGQRKVVLATAVAETSLTIEGVGTVVDAGWERAGVFDPNSGMSRLITRRLSVAGAEQRRGRAGRLGPGVCFRLWSESEQQRLAPFSPPEIRQSDLAPLVLELACWGARSPDGLFWLDKPPEAAWQQARDLLLRLEALDSGGGITPHGRAMLATGLSPRIAHMLVRGRALGMGRAAAELAALLGERDLFAGSRDADLERRILALRGELEDSGVDRGRLHQVRAAARRLGDGGKTPHVAATGRLLMLAYPDRVARRRPGSEARYRLANGRGAVLSAEDPLGIQDWLVVADLDGQAREARIFLAAAVGPADIEALLGAQIRERDEVLWDDVRGTVVARRLRTLDALVLEERPLPAPPAGQVTDALVQALRRRGARALPWTAALLQWRARVQLMHGLEPDQWPDLGDRALEDELEDWLGPYLTGTERLSDVTADLLSRALRGRLDFARRQRLDQTLPERIRVPSGFDVAVDYCAENGPVLAVKLQEMFGLTASPVLADGRIPLVIHLLSPARRPLAVTGDLESFWREVYPQVRREMRGRYPKHPWPEDPLTALPQRNTKRSKPN